MYEEKKTSELQTRSSQTFTTFIHSLDELKRMYDLALQNYRPIVNGERYLTDQETADILRVTRRTLNDYRAEGIIPYVQLGGKVLYAESDIEHLLQANYHPAFKRTS